MFLVWVQDECIPLGRPFTGCVWEPTVVSSPGAPKPLWPLLPHTQRPARSSSRWCMERGDRGEGGEQRLTRCSFGLSATSQQYFSLRTNQPPAISQKYFSLRTNQHQPSATSQTNRPLRLSALVVLCIHPLKAIFLPRHTVPIFSAPVVPYMSYTPYQPPAAGPTRAKPIWRAVAGSDRAPRRLPAPPRGLFFHFIFF
jgi:hypothetical protein